MRFADRYDAGRRLAAPLEPHRVEHPLVLGLPRGGVVVGFEIAAALGCDLDVLVVRKLGVPGAEEIAMGAVAPGATMLNQRLLAGLGISRTVVEGRRARGRSAADRRLLAPELRGAEPPELPARWQFRRVVRRG